MTEYVTKEEAREMAKQAYSEGWRKCIGADDFPKIRRKTAESNFGVWWSRNHE